LKKFGSNGGITLEKHFTHEDRKQKYLCHWFE